MFKLKLTLIYRLTAKHEEGEKKGPLWLLPFECPSRLSKHEAEMKYTIIGLTQGTTDCGGEITTEGELQKNGKASVINCKE